MKKLLAVPVVLGALALSGCTSFMTGGGFIESEANDDSRAQFGFTYDQNKARFGGTYLDKNATNYPNGGVKFTFTGTPSGPLDEGSCVEGDDFSYRSTNPVYKGPPATGVGEFLACDNGEGGPGTGDGLALRIDDGPYTGYINADGCCSTKPVLGGNVQTHRP